jgi:superfamily II DNA helicase RecQ
MSVTLSTLLQKAALRLGYESLYAEQELAISSFISGKDIFVSLPTGYGKSLCFAILPSVFDALRGVETASIVLVISPLISIITDQVASFCAKGIAAAFVGDKSAVSGIKCGKYQVVFLSPESLFCSFEWRQMLCTDVYISNLVGVIVDEAHCIKKW